MSTAAVQAIPPQYPGATPYLTVRGADRAIEFYKTAFGATEVACLAPGGRVMHAELRVGAAPFMLTEEMPERGALSPQTLGGSASAAVVFVEDVDAFFARAIAAGCTPVMPVMNQFWGDRMGCLTDPFGHSWMFSTHIEDVSPEELPARAAAAMAGAPQPCN
ncbi:VOC family protein [Stagnimonas aquatica]|uniref:VOC family protein n=1 Tax=Stagnimonas aquatica TaxID=2689987 RepID=A0A3N0VLR0_9GAMM|nr:VOC family protein [Stagnimonas aquatica]ROH93726.1 VOC family protein [Stagnimonas aquatica]